MLLFLKAWNKYILNAYMLQNYRHFKTRDTDNINTWLSESFHFSSSSIYRTTEREMSVTSS